MDTRRVFADSRPGLRPHLAATALAAAVTGMAACAPAVTGSEQGRRPDILTAEEIAGSPARDALDAVRQLRPTWLRTHGSQSIVDPAPPVPVIYVAHQRYGAAETLSDFRVEDVHELRYLSPSDATTRYGTGHRGGVIEVVLSGRGGGPSAPAASGARTSTFEDT